MTLHFTIRREADLIRALDELDLDGQREAAEAVLRHLPYWLAEDVLHEIAGEMGYELATPHHGTGVEGYA